MRILAVGCHPDDLEISCYGTLAKYVKEGHEVSVCHMTNGDLGHVEIMPDELAEMRFAEAEAAAAVIGAKHYSVASKDLYVNAFDDAAVARLSAVMREVRPDVILTHSKNDYMNDHEETYQAVMRASFCASLPHYDLSSDTPVTGVTPVFQMDPVSGLGFTPTEFVDITETMELKLQALSCHVSQIKWMYDHDHIDFLAFVRACSTVRGFQCGVTYAEGFMPAIQYLRMTVRRLLP